MKILWTKSGKEVDEGQPNDRLCHICGHDAMAEIWEQNKNWHEYDYEGEWVTICKYCRLLQKDEAVLENPETPEQKKQLVILQKKHERNRNRLRRKRDELVGELKNVKKEIKKFGY